MSREFGIGQITVSCSSARKRLHHLLAAGSPAFCLSIALGHRHHFETQLCTLPRMPLRCQSFTRLGRPADSYYAGQVTINMLPDEAFLEVFDLFLYGNECIDGLVASTGACVPQMAERHRVIFGSPRRLTLHLYCTAGRPVKAMLDIWPPFPIIINGFSFPVIIERGQHRCGIAAPRSYK